MENISLSKNEKELILKALDALRFEEYYNYRYGNLTPEERGYAEVNYEKIGKLIKKVKNW